ncbi:MAG: hypothetical protein Q7U37_11030 [Gallionella sp.]|nr:hypothetical protein [Gallionella sp.]
MALPWLAVLKIVPWTDVISNAPKVADGAKKLWNAIGKQPPAPKKAAPAEHTAAAPEAQSITASRLNELEAATAQLHEQMLASSELIKALAEQNNELIRHIETSRVRMRRMWLAIVITGILAASALTR